METIKSNLKYLGGLSLIYGVIFAFCLYRNLTGITFTIIVLVTIICTWLFLKKIGQVIKKSVYLYYGGMLLLGISTAVTDNSFFHFFNVIGIILLMVTGLLHQLYEDDDWRFTTYLKNFFILGGRFVISIITPIAHGIDYMKEERSGRKKTILAVFVGLGFALLLSFIIVPLLMGSDRIFQGLLHNILRNIDIWQIVGIFFTFLLGCVSSYALFVAVLRKEMATAGTIIEDKKMNSVIGISFTAVFASIYLVYSVIQILFLFLRFEGGLPEGVTYSEYAHAGFWQLLFVSFINFIMVLACFRVFRRSKVLQYLLLIISICTCIMTVSALYRILLYVGTYHLTFLRILVLWFLGVVTLFMVGVVINIFKVKFRLFKYLMVILACSYILLSFARVDFIIATYNLNQMRSGIAQSENINDQIFYSTNDIHYLMNDLSLDAAPALVNVDVSDFQGNQEQLEVAVDRYFERILQRDNTGRSWNLSLHIAQRAGEEHLEQ